MTTKLDKLRQSLEDVVRAGEMAKASLERLDFKSIQIGDEVIIVGGKLVETEVKRDGRIAAKIYIPTGDNESVISTWVYWEDIRKAEKTGYVKADAWACLTTDGEIGALRRHFNDAQAYAAQFPNMPVVPIYFAPDANKDEALKKAYCRGVEDYKDGARIDAIAENLLARYIREKRGETMRVGHMVEDGVVYQLEIKQVGIDAKPEQAGKPVAPVGVMARIQEIINDMQSDGFDEWPSRLKRILPEIKELPKSNEAAKLVASRYTAVGCLQVAAALLERAALLESEAANGE